MRYNLNMTHKAKQKNWKGIALLVAAALLFSGCATPALPEKADRPEGLSEDEEHFVPREARKQSVFHNEETGTDYAYRVDGKYLSIYDGEEFVPTYLNGVNIGSGYPGYFPGELAIPKDTYARWFKQISEMNCNCIRIYTTMKPAFYEAFAEFNRMSERKLYLIMGVWYDEDKILETADAFDVLDYAIDEAKEQIDIIHGDCVIEERAGRAYGSYKVDVSEYVLGWILGIESDANFVGTTMDNHPDLTSYDGTYFYTEDTDAFHVFLTELADETVAYETEKYGMQRPVSWANWPTADDLGHPEEPLFEMEDAVTINAEWIKPKPETFPAGTFASYHVYPYYPDFMMLEEKYTTHLDRDGNVNTYEAYLQDLMSIHTIPVLVAEFGVPSSRGSTHVNKYTHFDQGHLSETEQGAALQSMATDIYKNGYCGGIMFTWQDEWFKRTWNTMDYTDADRRPFWSDIQTSEQNFGLVSFDPGAERMAAYVDGDFEEWENEEPLTAGDGFELYAKEDERYLYLCVRGDNFSPENDRAVISLDVTPESGSFVYHDYSFDRAADFVVDLNGKEKSTVLVHRYYDRYAFAFSEYDDQFDPSGYDQKDSKLFVPIYLSLNRTLWVPTTGEKLKAERLDTGKLSYGNGNPEDDAYDSLADFCYGDDFVEARIPWELFSFRDPSTKEIEGDFWANGELSGIRVTEIYFGLSYGSKYAKMQPFAWEDWDEPTFHERLKPSYAMLKETYEHLRLTSVMLSEEEEIKDETEE